MKQLLLSGFLLLALGLAPHSLLAAQRGTERLVTDAAAARNLMSIMDDAVWAPDGDPADKQVYVLYGTDCEFSRQLHADIRGLSKGVQWRWIAITGQTSGRVVTERTAAAVREAFTAGSASIADPVRAQRAITVNTWTGFATPGLGGSFTYPMLIYATDQGARIHFGAPADLQKIVAQIRPRPDRANYSPASLHWLTGAQEPLVLARDLHKLQNYDPALMEIRVAPHPSARVADHMPQGNVLPVRGFLGTDWVEVVGITIEDQPVPGYIRAPRAIRLATLDFTVKPATGQLDSGSGDVEFRSHPDPEAPVLYRSLAGYTVPLTGQTTVAGKNWNVITFDHGAFGYTLQGSVRQ